MESDSTVPATDDFESRFLEMDDDEDTSDFEISSMESAVSTPRSSAPSRSGNRGRQRQTRRTSSKSTKPNRPVRHGRRPPARVAEVYADASDSDSEPSPPTLPTPSARSRTRTGYLSSQSSLWTLEDVMVGGDRSTDQAALPSNPTPTPEQLEIRQRRIERRRESAKNKAEKEMQDTVERLLRVNTEYAGSYASSGRGGRGRGRRPVIGPTDANSDSDAAKEGGDAKNALHPSLPLDPPRGTLRFISSHRLRPHCVLALPTTVDSDAFLPKVAPPPPKQRLCEQCEAAPRRYACPTSGRSLCSLECFKAMTAC
ncbi:unnamed protein product [Mesocestoides corti]|uniref:PAPA-1 domain-containing protein n=1 Tax=Mesocestoides corti TaxID=53468 RepID=A0A0R3U669_MESCO|nr:unnamed protein product [Mesocestoides corti]